MLPAAAEGPLRAITAAPPGTASVCGCSEPTNPACACGLRLRRGWVTGWSLCGARGGA